MSPRIATAPALSLLALALGFVACVEDDGLTASSAPPAADGGDASVSDGLPDAGAEGGRFGEIDAGPEPVGLVLASTVIDYSCAVDHHVAVSGDDTTGDGSEANPYRTVAKALALALPGHCVRVHEGTYKETAPLTFPSDGAAGLPIVLMSADGPRKAVLDGSDNTTGAIVEVNHDHNVIDGFAFSRPAESPHPLVRFDGQSAGKCAGSVLRASRLSGGFNLLKVYQRTQSVLVEHNELTGPTGGAAVSATGATGMIFRANYSHDLDTKDDGTVQLAGGSANVVFERNLFEDIKSLGGALSLGEACDCDEDPDHYAAVNARAINNLFIRVRRPFDVHGCRGCAALANTILDSGDESRVFRIGYARSAGFDRPTVDLRVLNNIIANRRPLYAYVVDITPGASAGMQLDYNLYWNGPAAVFFGESRPSGSDIHSLQANPFLTSATDFRPTAGSLALGAGADLSAEVPSDYVGTARPAGPADIGAFQR